MARTRDLTGQRFGRLVALEIVGRSKDKRALWRCLCDCGGGKVAVSNDIIKGHTRSCGCLVVESLDNRGKQFKEQNYKHGAIHTKLYQVWRAMRARCSNPNAKEFHRYGARGVSVSSEFSEYIRFESFALETGYKEGLQIDRIDVNGNYERGNIRWSTPKQQARNRRHTKYFEGIPLAAFCEQNCISYSMVLARMHRGWTLEDAVNTPRKPSKWGL